MVQTLIEALVSKASTCQERTIYTLGRRSGDFLTLSFGDVYARARRFALLYREAGLQPDDTVSIVLDLGEDLLAAFWGAQLGGLVPSILPPPNERQDVGHYWKQLEAQSRRMSRGLMLVRPDMAQVLKHVADGSALSLATPNHLPADANGEAYPLRRPHDIAFLQHSSGTTGIRKGVALSHEAVVRQIESYADVLDLVDDDVIVSWLPLYHDMGLVTSLIMPLLTGTPAVLLDPLDWVAHPGKLLAAITLHRGTLCWMPNFAFLFLARAPLSHASNVDLSGMRAFINCSEPCKPETFDAFLNRFSGIGARPEQLQTCYAMAEAVFAVTQTPLGEAVARLKVDRKELLHGRISLSTELEGAIELLPVGTAIAGAGVSILSEDGSQLPDGCVGEISIRAPFLFEEYFHEPELTNEVLRDGRYLSGDLGAVYAGQLYVTGRKKDVIIVHGRNYYSHDIEMVVSSVPGVHPGRCVALGVYQAETGSEVVHVVAESAVSESEGPRLARQVKEVVQLQLGLTIYRVSIVADRWLIKTTSGKVSRRENLEKYLQGRGSAPTIERIQEVMRFIFLNDDLIVTPHTTALDVDGWDSLAHSMLILELERSFGIEIVAERASECANVGELAGLIDGTSTDI